MNINQYQEGDGVQTVIRTPYSVEANAMADAVHIKPYKRAKPVENWQFKTEDGRCFETWEDVQVYIHHDENHVLQVKPNGGYTWRKQRVYMRGIRSPVA